MQHKANHAHCDATSRIFPNVILCACPCGGGAGPCGFVHLFFFFFSFFLAFQIRTSDVQSPTCARRERQREGERAREREGEKKVGVHTSCAVWLHGASLEMSSPSRCAHRRILPT